MTQHDAETSSTAHIKPVRKKTTHETGNNMLSGTKIKAMKRSLVAA
jgi:hypothetical protein